MTGGGAEDDEENVVKTPRPTARRVAARAGVLVALCYRALLDRETENLAEVRAAHERLLAWVRGPDVARELEPRERAVIEAPLGRVPSRRLIDASWAAEPAGVLAWALDRFALPRYDEKVDGAGVAKAIHFLNNPWPLPEEAVLRPAERIEAGWASALTLHWRLREQVHHPGSLDFVDFVERCPWAPLTLDGLDVRDRDLVVRGRLVTEAAPRLVHECLEIAEERHQAFEWLSGNASLWSEVTTDT